MIRHHHRRAQDGTRQRGAALVEFALIAPILMLLVAASFDLGQAWRTGLVASSATRAGARIGSNAGDSPLADYYLLTGMKSSLSADNLAKVRRVIVYKSTTTNGAVPAGCLSGSPGSAPCHILTGDQFRGMSQASFNATTGCLNAAATKNYCPSSRNSIQLTADYLGVYIELRQPYMFLRVMGNYVTIARETVMRLEPKES